MIRFILWWALTFYVWILLARVILSWLPMFAPRWEPRGLVLMVFEFIYTLTDPPVKFLRRWIKPVRMGQTSLDLSVLVLFFGLQLLQSFVRFIPF